MEKAIATCRKHGIDIQVDHIFGLPLESYQELDEAVDFYRELSPSFIYTYWLTYYPETSIIQKAIEADILADEDFEKISDGRGKAFTIKGRLSRTRRSLRPMRSCSIWSLCPRACIGGCRRRV